VAGPVQDSDFDRVIGSIFLKKSKRHCFSKKNKSQRVATRFLTGSYRVNWIAGSTSRVTQGFSFPCFFFNLAGPDFKTIFRNVVSIIFLKKFI
jgi:hypothetical protein